MLTLGFSGGIDRDHERLFDFAYDEIHDSAAVLVRNGVVIAGIEQERLSRIKHTNKSAGPAMRFCLEQAGVTLGDVDAIAYYATEQYTDGVLREMHLKRPGVPQLLTGRAMVQHVVEAEFGRTIPPEKVHFVFHHHAHAVTAFQMSGLHEALVMTIDGQGEGVSGVIYSGRDGELSVLRSIPDRHSLGFLYRDVIRFHGYDIFDEYKVMGLAPYGDAGRFRRALRSLYELLPDGEYRLHLDRVTDLYAHITPRRKGGPFTQEHLDLAAGLQEALEIVGTHVIRYFAELTGHRHLCMAGGVAHNCSMNGKFVYSGLFDRVFVQPASHDAGGALGAALAVDQQTRRAGVAPLTDVFWGTDLPDTATILKVLDGWSPWLEASPQDDPCEAGAGLMADGKVIGWVQGRSEFGPRALGNRSILADPRPAQHKDLINRMVKKREAYRPFAPSVLEERVADFFVVPPTQRDFPYMSVVLQVQPEQRDVLGAVTHIDGTARVQTVREQVNPRYWRLIDAFGRRTGVPVVLNTSFNNHAEPIVDSVEDAIVCFLTTDLHALIVGDALITKRAVPFTQWLELVVSRPTSLIVRESRDQSGDLTHDAVFNYSGGKSRSVSSTMYTALAMADGRQTMAQLTKGVTEDVRAALVDELLELWSQRMVILRPMV
ncbi:MAG: nodulation protein [Betaproteobacteria bacterium]|nr:nodulation protein [Betaproteobacteria bacterium]